MKKFILALNVFALLGCAYAVDVISATDLAANIAADPAGSYTLTSNIDCSDWVSVASFTGSIDGAGYEIQNLKVPMFDTVGGSGTFSNIVFKDACITSKVANASVGVLANNFDGENFQLFNLSFDGCSIDVTSAGNNLIGMIAGNFTKSGVISNCVVKSSCQISDSSNVSIGGFVCKAIASGAEATIDFVQCENALGTFSSNSTYYFGGITFNAETRGDSGKFAYINFVDCTNRTTITTSKTNSGFAGITYWASANNSGSMGAVSFKRCINYGSAIITGKITKKSYVGGIAGDCARGRFLFDSCINYGDLLASNVSDGNTIVGGIVSSVTTPIKQPVTIINCANLGDANGYYVGGFIGAITHSGNYTTTRWYINSSIQKGELTCKAKDWLAGEAIGYLNSSVTFPTIDFSGCLFQSDTLIGGYREGAVAPSILKDSSIYASLSNYLVDGTDLATLNSYNECNLWKQGSTSPILKIMADEPSPDIITVTFKDAESFDSKVLATYKISRGSSVIPPVNPEHEGYTFINWSTEDFSNLTEDTEIVATYLIGTLEYTVRFLDWDGSVIGEPQTIQYGESAIAPTAPLRDGYVFSGWDRSFSAIYEDTDVMATYVVANVDINNQEEFVAYLTAPTIPGVTYHLKDNIVLPSDWASIDLVANIDGGGYTLYNFGKVPVFSTLTGNVSNLTIDGYNSETEAKTEVKIEGDHKNFGVLASELDGGTISDVVIRNYIIKSGRYTTMGALVAIMSNGATICRVNIEDSCELLGRESYVGGIVGRFQRAENYCPVDEEGNVLVGSALVTICDSTNSAPIFITSSGNANVGGIVAEANIANTIYRFEMIISNCVNNASILPVEGLNATSVFHFGGFVGEREFNSVGDGGVLKIIDSTNYGNIASIGGISSYGGFIGATYRSAKAEFIRCQNRGNIGVAKNSLNEDITEGYAAGFVGHVSELYSGNPFYFVNCANYGDIVGGQYAGGFLGDITSNGGHDVNVSIINSANYGALSIVNTEAGEYGQSFAAFMTVMANGTFTITISNCLFTASNTYGMIAEQTKEKAIAENIGLNQVYVDDLMTVKAMQKSLDAYAQENANEPWVLGVVDNKVYPELECFAERIFSLETLIIIK